MKGKKHHKTKATVLLCPYCGNEIPFYSNTKVFRCKYCNSEIPPEENNVREVREYAKGK